MPDGTDWVAVLEARDWARDGQRAGGGARSHSARDPRFLLRVLTEEWRAFDGDLSRVEQSYASELREAGDRWAHHDAFSGEDTSRALDTMERPLTAVGAADQAAEVGPLRLDHQRALFEAQARRTVKAAVSTVATPGAGLNPDPPSGR